jgi:hypothetical protein
MLSERLGWKDIHASSKDFGDAIKVSVSMADHANHAKDRIRPYLPENARRLYRMIKKAF